VTPLEPPKPKKSCVVRTWRDSEGEHKDIPFEVNVPPMLSSPSSNWTNFGGGANVEGVTKTEALSPDRKMLAVGEEGLVRLLDARTGKARIESGPRWLVDGLRFTPDSRRLLTSEAGGTTRLWDLQTGNEVRRVPGRPYLPANDNPLSAMEDEEGEIRILDRATGKVWQRLVLTEEQRRERAGGWSRLVLSPDGTRLLATTKRGGYLLLSGEVAPSGTADTVYLWDIPNKRVLCTFLKASRSGDDGWVTDAGFSPDGSLVAAAAEGGLRLRWAATGRKIRTLPEVGGPFFRFAFSPDGKLLATVGDDPTIHLWESATGTLVHSFHGHRGPIRCLAFAPDGRALASASNDSTVLVWDVPGSPVSPGRGMGGRELNTLWADLAADPARAFRVQKTLAEGVEASVPFLHRRLRDAALPCTRERLARLLPDLDAPRAAVRISAANELARFGPIIAPALRRLLKDRPPLEVCHRVESLLERMEDMSQYPSRLRVSRAIGLLERLGTPEARRVLQQLARGPAESAVTEEARAATARLAPR
jgi:WD40 repeat protein